MALTEALYLDLMAEGIGTIGVTIAMPGIIRTDIMAPEKASPAALGLDRAARHANRTVRGMERLMASNVETAMDADALAAQVLDAAAAGRLYTSPNGEREQHVAVARSIGLGRVMGDDPWPALYAGISRSMAAADETA